VASERALRHRAITDSAPQARERAAPQPRLAVRVVGRLSLVLFGLALALGGTELAMHLLGPSLPGLYNLATFNRYHPDYGFFHRPGARGWIKTPEYTSYVQINSRGLRDREITLPKPNGTYRLLVLGDSFVEGAQVALDETLPKQLERQLGGGQGGQGRPLDAINAGNAGFGTAQEMLFLEHEGPVYQPNLVVLVFYVDNDAANNGVRIARKYKLDTEHRPFFVLDDSGDLRELPLADVEPEPFGSVRDFLRNHSLLFNVGENLLTAKVSAKQYHAMRMDKDKTMYRMDPPNEWKAAWEVTEALLARAKASSNAIGADLLVVCAPSQFQIYEQDWRELLDTDNPAELAKYDQDAPTRRLAEVAEDAGVAMFDLTPGIRAAAVSGDTPLYFHEDGHWTPTGHAVAARLIAAYLREQGLISEGAPARLAVAR
jgi:hypothetical protein